MLYFAHVQAPGACPTARHPRAQQSLAAARLLADLRARTGLDCGPSSKSHSRAISAAAIAASGQIGVDVEFACPARNLEGISQFLLGSTPLPSPCDIYRLWTFREAYFKAFGAPPSPAMMEDARHACAAQLAGYCLGAIKVPHFEIDAHFQLTLVWNGDFAAHRIAA